MEFTVQSTNGRIQERREITLEQIQHILRQINKLNRQGLRPTVGLVYSIMLEPPFTIQDYDYWRNNWRGWTFSSVEIGAGRNIIKLKKKGVSG